MKHRPHASQSPLVVCDECGDAIHLMESMVSFAAPKGHVSKNGRSEQAFYHEHCAPEEQ